MYGCTYCTYIRRHHCPAVSSFAVMSAPGSSPFPWETDAYTNTGVRISPPRFWKVKFSCLSVSSATVRCSCGNNPLLPPGPAPMYFGSPEVAVWQHLGSLGGSLSLGQQVESGVRDSFDLAVPTRRHGVRGCARLAVWWYLRSALPKFVLRGRITLQLLFHRHPPHPSLRLPAPLRPASAPELTVHMPRGLRRPRHEDASLG